LIAAGLSPLRPEQAAMKAGRILIAEIDRLAEDGVDFSFETTLSGLAHAVRIRRYKAIGYRIEINYLALTSKRLALRRIAARVKQGGHDIPRLDVFRRFDRSWLNFVEVYRRMADRWAVYDNSGREPRLLEHGP
jgi:predicted ABC-type ATPase